MFNQKQIEKIVACGLTAGEIAARFQKSRDFQIMTKADNSKVTTADIEVSKFIAAKLTAEFPEIPLICEEGKLRQADDIFWLIDPIDGTSGFIDGITEFSVNIALIKDRKAVFGLIYAPLFEGGKMIFVDQNHQVVLQDNAECRKVLAFKKSTSDTLRIVTSPRTKDIDIQKYVAQFHLNCGDNFVTERLSSSVKFFRILENSADIYLHFRQSMEWDTAAGQAIVEAMKGSVKNLFLDNNKNYVIGENMSYKKPDFLNQSFITFVN